MEIFDLKDSQLYNAMAIDIPEINLDEEDLNFLKVFNHFEKPEDVLVVSKMVESKSIIDFDIVKSNLPSKVMDRPNLYALYIRKENEDWQIMYVGQRKNDGILERLRQHLIKKHKLTGSKLYNVNKALEKDFDIGIKLFSIRPNTM